MTKDSRSTVIAELRRRDQEQAPVYRASKQRQAQLRKIAAETLVHDERVLKALKTGDLTAAEAVQYLDTTQPHARLNAIRQRLPVISRWVQTVTATGNSRRVKAYRLEQGGPG